MNLSIDLARPKRLVNATQQVFTADKPIASGAGISCSITLAEPHVYLHGFDQNSHERDTEHSAAMIRGKLVLDVTKCVKIKAVTLIFSGKARTEWPEGKNGTRYCLPSVY
jgi:arrestin-related trafficking adapter 3/6